MKKKKKKIRARAGLLFPICGKTIHTQSFMTTSSSRSSDTQQPNPPKEMELGQQLQQQEQRQMENMDPKSTKGGLVTMPFIIANEALEKVASYGLAPNMIFYLMSGYNVGIPKGTSILFLWSAATNFTPALGAFLADSYLGRFFTIALGTISTFLGMTLLWLTAMIPSTRPSPCDRSTQNCEPASASQMALLIASFALMAIGAGGIRPCSLAFGADQFDKRDNPGNERVLESYFSWYYASAAASVVVALSCMVYIQDHLGWKIGYGVPTVLLFLSAFLFLVASPLYVKLKASNSLFIDLVQTIVAAYKNRKLDLSKDDSDIMYYNKKGAEIVILTDKLRFLNKACVVANPEKDVSSDGTAVDPWSLCTVEQVEELKALLKVIPVWSTGMLMSINVSQTSFPVLQASSMDRHIAPGSSFQIPAGSFYVFLVIAIAVWVILYDRVIIPSVSKLRGKPVRLGVMARMGIGISFSTLAMVVSAIVEHVRRGRAIREGLADNPQAVVHMSAMWLVPQYCLQGLAEAFNAIAQTEFYYTEFPKSMSSIASCLSGLGIAVANVLAIPIVNAVDKITSRGGKPSWISDNINRGYYDKYYWLLAFISFANIFYFLACSWAYGPLAESGVKDRQAQGRGRTPIREQGMGKSEKM